MPGQGRARSGWRILLCPGRLVADIALSALLLAHIPAFFRSRQAPPDR